jgi:hypothetical protein
MKYVITIEFNKDFKQMIDSLLKVFSSNPYFKVESIEKRHDNGAYTRDSDKPYYNENLFYKEIERKITNLFLENKNFEIGGSYSRYNVSPYTTLEGIKKNAKILLQDLERLKHLIIPENEL